MWTRGHGSRWRARRRSASSAATRSGRQLQASGEPNNLQRVALQVDRGARRHAHATEQRGALLRHQDRRARHDRAGRPGAPVRGRRRLYGQGLDRRRDRRRRRLPGRAVAERLVLRRRAGGAAAGRPADDFRLKPVPVHGVRWRPGRGAARRPRRRPQCRWERSVVPAGRRALRLRVGGRLPRAPAAGRASRAAPRRGATTTSTPSSSAPRGRRRCGARAHRLPPRQGAHLAREDQAAAADVRRRVARSGRRRSASVKFSRVAGCKGKKYKLRSTKRYRGRFGPKSMRVTIRRPRKTGFYYGSVTFKGSPYVRAGVDPFPLLLTKTRKKRVGFADPQAFPRLPRLQALKRAVAEPDRDRVEDLEREDALRLLVEEADERPRAVALLDERGGEQLRRGLERPRGVDVPRAERRGRRARTRCCGGRSARSAPRSAPPGGR